MKYKAEYADFTGGWTGIPAQDTWEDVARAINAPDAEFATRDEAQALADAFVARYPGNNARVVSTEEVAAA